MKSILKYYIFILCSIYSVTSHGVEIDGIEYSLNTNKTASVVERKNSQKYSGDIVIPETIIYNDVEYAVTSVSFYGSDELVSLSLPKTVEVLGDEAMRGCSSLRSITIPGVKTIGKIAFFGCSSLESITFGEGISSFGQGAFTNCNKLKSVYVPDLNTWLHVNCSYLSAPLENGADLYINGEKLINLVIPDNITSINSFNFYYCTSIEEITIQGPLTIKEDAFSHCVNLRKLTINADCTLDQGCFSNCTNLQDVILNAPVDYSWSAVYYHNYPFAYCDNIKYVQLSSNLVEEDAGIQRVYNGAGYYNYKDYEVGYISDLFPTVEELWLSEDTKCIGCGKFAGCDSLKGIHIPASISEIGNDAFSGCRNLKKVVISNIESFCQIKLGKRYYYSGSWRDEDATCANPLMYGADLYVNEELVTNLVIPNSITSIEWYAFNGCNSIEKLTIPEGVEKIGDYAFKYCKNLKSVSLPNSLTTFGRSVFWDCDKLVSAGPQNSNCSIEYGWTTDIPVYALCEMPNLQTILIPSTIQSIGDKAFAYLTYFSSYLPINSIYCSATVPPTIHSKTFYCPDSTPTVFVPRDCKEAYSKASYWQNFNIIELVDVESIKIEKDKYDIIVGESKDINVTILPDKATYKDLYWAIDNPEIARVDSGVVVGVKTGITKVTATTTDGTNLSASCLISVTNPVLSVTLSKDQIELEAEDTETITAICLPSNADDTSISWKSSNTNVATVDNGIIKAVAVGKTEITASSANGIEASCKVVVKPTIATSLKLNKKSLSLTAGNSEKLEASILPTKTTNKEVKWESSNTEIVSVDNTGIVTALSNGTAKISASTIDGSNLSDECVVTVTTLATNISLNQNNANLIVGQSLSLNATILPSTTSNKNISWQSNNSNCASVSSEGIVYANATGTATITATTSDETNLAASCVIIVTNPVISVTLDKTNAELMVGQQLTITASCIPSNADNTTITWSSSDNTVATVVNGVVTAKKLGNVIITASSANGLEAKCTINVVPTPITLLSLSESTKAIVKDEKFKLICTISPDDATNKELIWRSLNDGIANVDENGIVTGISTGETTIIVEAKSNSKISANCKVKVITPVISLKLEQETQELYVEDGLQLSAECTPTDADNTQLEWTSSDDNVASVSGDGYVTTRNEGNVRVTATTTDGTNLFASCEIIVKKRKQTISWSQDLSYFQNGGEMIVLEATSSSMLPVTFTSSDENIISIYDLGDMVYANPVNCGTAYITANQEGNYKYEPVEIKRKIEVEGTPFVTSRTLVVYYSQSSIIDGIVAELANQLSASNISVTLQKVEPTNPRINEANCNDEVRDSIMNIIGRYPDEANSYPAINPVNQNVNQYDNIIMVYPLWNSTMAAPMQTFNFNYNDILEKKSVAYIEYDLFGEMDTASSVKVLKLCGSDIDNMTDLIGEWVSNSVATGLIRVQKDKNRLSKGIYDLHGRRLTDTPNHGIYIVDGVKTIK